jgi:hypothetical protein
MQDALPGDEENLPDAVQAEVEKAPPTDDEILNSISEYDLCYGESDPGDGDDDVPVVSEPGAAEYYPETGAVGIVDEAPEDDGEEEELPEEAVAMIHEEVGKDPFIRDKGNVERIALAAR